jgi:Flp pilus assembly protein TadG
MQPSTPQRQSGQVLVLVALLLVVLLGSVGLAIDAGRLYGVKAKLNSAVDAAAIAGARALAQGDTDPLREAAAIQAARDYYLANFPALFEGAEPVPLNTSRVTAVHDLASGYWTVNVQGAATMPVTLMRLLGVGDVTVSAESGAVRRDLDIILVLDSSGSIGSSMAGLKAAAINFVNKFNAGTNGDRVGLVSFASGAELDVPIDKTGARGFNRANVITAINLLASSGATASAEGMRRALNDINGVPLSARSSLRMIVFFSDGAPNNVPATFCNGAVTLGACSASAANQPAGDLYSETSNSTVRPRNIYNAQKRNLQLGSYTNITTLPAAGFGLTEVLGAPVVGSEIPLNSYNNIRSLALVSPTNGTRYPYTNTRCNVNKAARNMIENVANTARNQKIKVYSIALGSAVNTQEITFCGYGGSELGANLLKRIANTTSADTHNAAQPEGLYVWAQNASELDAAFSTIASEILRLSK